jgi:hypothetical protein
VDVNRRPLAFGFINRIVVLRQLQKIVLACNRGIFWAAIPPPGGTYLFSQVFALPGQRFSGLAEGPASTIVAGAWGTDLISHYGIFVGTWSGATNTFNFKSSTTSGLTTSQMRRTDIASHPMNRMRLYAICGGGNNVTVNRKPSGAPILDDFGNVTWVNDNDFILAVLRSDDGGLTWSQTGTSVKGETQPLFPGSPSGDLAGHTNNGYTGCVGIFPFNPDIVAIGVVKPFLSIDGGANWVLYDEETNSHLHDDTHALVFDPADGSTLHVCSDGGLATTPDLGGTWRSTANRQMPIQEVYDFSESSKDSGLITASLQDNGNIYASLYIDVEPWRTLEPGDGEVVLFLSNGDLVRQNNELISKDPSGTPIDWGHQLRAAWWDSDGRQFHNRSMFPDPPLSWGVIPIDGPLDGLSIPKVPNPAHCICKVTNPLHVNADNEPMMAVAAVGTAVLGIFVKPDGTSHWQFISEIPLLPGDPLPYFATAVQSPDGTYIFVGTNNGRIFRLEAPLFLATNLSDPAVSLQITDIVAFAPDQAVLIASTDVFRRVPTGWQLIRGKVVGGVKLELPVRYHRSPGRARARPRHERRCYDRRHGRRWHGRNDRRDDRRRHRRNNRRRRACLWWRGRLR